MKPELKAGLLTLRDACKELVTGYAALLLSRHVKSSVRKSVSRRTVGSNEYLTKAFKNKVSSGANLPKWNQAVQKTNSKRIIAKLLDRITSDILYNEDVSTHNIRSKNYKTKEIVMNYQKHTPECVLDILKENNVQLTDANIDYFAYPITFNSTAGPCGGIGGSSMSTFTVESYVCNQVGPTVYVCAGMFVFDNSKWEPFKNIKDHWRKLKHHTTPIVGNKRLGG